LKRFGGNKEMVAKTLSVDLTTLYRKMNKFGIDDEDIKK
jgi:DNA-binding NtrC family response regulator